MKQRIVGYPCRNRLDGGGEVLPEHERRCGGPSQYHARGNEARYGHVCQECWESFDDVEKALYGWVRAGA